LPTATPSPGSNSPLELSKFRSIAKRVAETLNASFADDGAKEFLAGLFEAYVAEGESHDCRSWLEQALRRSFLCMDERPAWVGAAHWPFHGGKPMTFVFQRTIGATAQHLPIALGDTVYTFVSKTSVEGGWATVYRLVVTDEEGHRFLPRESDQIVF
jgi:hypothetical protein